jgi:glycosyltransferase involved in cell wall biosynthesis
MNFSILICTKNSSRLLGEVFDSIFSQSSIHLVGQIIVVDYESTDHTSKIAQEHCAKAKFENLHILQCTTSGKGAALIMGMGIVTGDYCIIVDDDNILSTDFVETADCYLSTRPLVGCIGSRGKLDSKLAPPNWFNQYQGAYAVGLPAGHENLDWVWGACCIINMNAWRCLNACKFQFILNPERIHSSAPIAIGGEDVELSLAIRMIGYEVKWFEKLSFIHSFQQSRLSQSYFLKNNLGVCRSAPIHSLYRLVTQKENCRFPYLIWSFGVGKNLIGSGFRICKFALIGNKFECAFHWTVFLGIFQGFIAASKNFRAMYSSLLILRRQGDTLSRGSN